MTIHPFDERPYNAITEKKHDVQITSIEMKCKEKFGMLFEALIGIRSQTEVIFDGFLIGKSRKSNSGIFTWTKNSHVNIKHQLPVSFYAEPYKRYKLQLDITRKGRVTCLRGLIPSKDYLRYHLTSFDPIAVNN